MRKLDWNRERYRTRDRLLDYTLNLYPIIQPIAEMPYIYPWENIQLGILSKQILELAKQNGYTGDEQLLWERFSEGTIVTGTLNTFPIPGDEKKLYLDTETTILYYFKFTTNELDFNLIARIGGAIVGTSIIGDTVDIIKYLYLPIHALPIENTILNNG